MQKQGEKEEEVGDISPAAQSCIVFWVATGGLVIGPDGDTSFREKSFSEMCNGNTDLFGTKGSKLRYKCQQRMKNLRRPERSGELYEEFSTHHSSLVALYNPKLYQPSSYNSSSDQSVDSKQKVKPTRKAKTQPPKARTPPPEARTPPPKTRTPPPNVQQHIFISPSPIHEQRYIMATETPSPSNRSFVLSFDDPTLNPRGVLAMRRPHVESGSTLVDQVIVYFALGNHLKDEANHIRCRLSEDGTMLIVNQSAQPCALVGDMKKFHYFSTSKGESEKEASIIVQLQALKDVARRSRVRGNFNKDTSYKFPSGITCNSDHFNPNKGHQLAVDTELFVFPYDDADDSVFIPMFKVRLAVDETERQIAAADDELNDVTKALSSMSVRLAKFKKG